MAVTTMPFSASLHGPLASSPPFLRIAKLAAATCAHRLRCYGSSSTATAGQPQQQQRQQRQQEGRNQLRSPDLVALEYADLNLPHKLSEELGHVRIRQHVNPLSSSFSMPAQAPNWDEVLEDPTLPLMVDIGCGEASLVFESLCHAVTCVCIHCNCWLDSPLCFWISTVSEFSAE